MVDFTSTKAQAKEVAPPARCEGGQDEAIIAKPLGRFPYAHRRRGGQEVLPTDGDPRHRHRALTSRLRPIAMRSMIRLAPSPPTHFSSQAPPWQR
jgi:hypothetical protein